MKPKKFWFIVAQRVLPTADVKILNFVTPLDSPIEWLKSTLWQYNLVNFFEITEEVYDELRWRSQ